MEWASVSYSCKFKPLTLHQFNGNGSPSQHIYYFRSQTENIVTNDALLTRHFIASLKDLAFDWFIRLQPGTIKAFSNLESLFLA